MNLPFDPTAIYAAFASVFSQSNRLMRLSFAPGSGIADDLLLPWQLTGHEAINEGFRYELICLSADAYLPLKELMGQAIEVSLLTDTGDYRPLCGWITTARQDGTDGGMSRYTLIIEDLFAVLSRRINNRIFQEISAKDAVLTLLREYQTTLADSLDIIDRTTRDYPTQALISQLNESDADLCKRKLADEGINYYFSYGDAGACSDRPKITLVLFDDNSQLPDNPAGVVRYHRADGTEQTDSITDWQSERQLVAGSVYRASPDYKPVVVNHQQDTSRLNQGSAGNALAHTLEDYRYEVPHYGRDADDYARYTTQRMQAHEYAGKQFTGAGTVRAFTIGRFTLTDHPEIDQHDAIDREFILSKIALNAHNNLPPEVQAQAKQLTQSNTPSPSQGEGRAEGEKPFSNTFVASRNLIPIVPKTIPTPAAPQLMSAIVVGPEGEEICVDSQHRVKVNLQYPRTADHPNGGAGYNERDSVWLRTLQLSASAEFGSSFLPRVGDEVVLGFLGGDPDRPIILGPLYNGTHKPATFSHAGDLPGNKALSGIKSKMYKGQGANELVLDDSTNEQRIRLATDHGQSALNLGYNVHPRVDGKGNTRGEGFELRTDLWGALRAAHGLLISTDARRRATGSQQDWQELIGQMELTLGIFTALSELATTHHAEDTDAAPQEQLLEHVKHLEAGSNTDKNGDKAKGGQPILALNGQAGIAISTPQNTTIATGTNLDMVSAQDTSITTGRHCKVRAAEMISLFAHKQGIKQIAASGNIDMQAQNGNVEIIASEYLILTGIKDVIINGPLIQFNAQGAGADIGNGQFITKTLGTHTQHAANHINTGPAAPNFTPPKMPKSELKTNETFAASGRGGQAREALPYKLSEISGKVLERGDTASNGDTPETKDTRINL